LDFELSANLSGHPSTNCPALLHRYAVANDEVGSRLIRRAKQDGPQKAVLGLQAAYMRVSLANLGPSITINIQGKDG
jgi:hypothetical protein